MLAAAVQNAEPLAILIVDDDQGVTDTFARMLRLEGYTVYTAVNPESGLDLAIEKLLQAIILDLRMPILNGIQFLRRLRTRPDLPETPVAIVTGDYFIDEGITEQLKTLGASIRFKPLWLDTSCRSRTVSPRRPPARFQTRSTISEVNDRFLRACRREPVDATPVWFMRQAGRYMAEYRAIRERHTLLEICRQPELAAEVTLQPIDRLDVDAAILFSDLLLPLEPMGIPFDFVKGEGPVIHKPVRTAADIARLRAFEPRESLAHVLATIRVLSRELADRVPLIGFGGAPFTLASYAVEGGPSSNYAKTKALMYGEPAAWHQLCEAFAGVVSDYLVAQVEAGAQAVQLFDSWIGALSPSDYREFALPHSQRILRSVAATGVPVLHFGTGTATLLEVMTEAGGDVIGVDWRVPLDDAWARIGDDRAVQGNLDPTLLLGPIERMLVGADDVLQRAGRRPGHIFNLGHGILPDTPVEHVQALAHFVHQYGSLP